VFPRIEYVDWIRPRIEAATHDLGSSDLRPEAGDSNRVVPAGLADRPTPEEGLRPLVAAAYDVDAEQVLVTPGASSANLLAMAVALGESASSTGAFTEGTAAGTPEPRGRGGRPVRVRRPLDRVV